MGALVAGDLVGVGCDGLRRDERDGPAAGHRPEGPGAAHLGIGQTLSDRGAEVELGLEILEVESEVEDVGIRHGLGEGGRHAARIEEGGPHHPKTHGAPEGGGRLRD